MGFWIPNNWLLRQQVARADFEAQKDQQAESESDSEGRPWWLGPLNWYGEQAQRGMDFAKGFGSAFTGLFSGVGDSMPMPKPQDVFSVATGQRQPEPQGEINRRLVESARESPPGQWLGAPLEGTDKTRGEAISEAALYGSFFTGGALEGMAGKAAKAASQAAKGAKVVPKKGTIVPKEGTAVTSEAMNIAPETTTIAQKGIAPARNIEQPTLPVEPVQIAPTRATEPLIGGAGIKPPIEPPRGAVAGAGKSKPGFAGNIRLSKFPTEVHDDLNKWAEDAGRVATRRRGTRSHQVTLDAAQDLADMVGGDPVKIAKRTGQAYNAEEQAAISGMLVQTQKELNKVRMVVGAGNDTTVNLLRVKGLQDKLAYWVGLATSARAEAGRALESFKIINRAMKSQDTKVMESVLKRVGGRENIGKFLEASKGLDWDNPVAINNFIRSMNRPRLEDYIFEVYVNSILSGPKTHIVNTLSNAMTATISPLETMGAAVIEKGLARLQGRQPARYLGEARYEAAGALQGFQSGVRGALHTLRHGIRPDAMTKLEFRPSAFSGKFGRVVNSPSTALEAADEFFYNINYRMALNKQAYRAAKARGLSGQKLLDDMADTIANPTDDIIEAAVKQAQQRLFRQEAGKTTQKLMAMREDQPILRFFLPFLRTPVNLVKFGVERSPLGFLNPKLIQNLRAGNPQAAEQLANAFIGTATATALYFYVKDGRITGAPPTSSSARDKFYAEGKQPYAIKIGNAWVSYQRLEPFNQMLAQLAALVGALEDDDEETAAEKFGAVAKDIGYNFASQTYMSGISDMIDALSDPERYGTSYANRLTGSLAVPYSALSRTVAQMMDTTIRRPTNPWEGIQANVPGLSQNVPASTSLKGVERERQSPAWSPISVTKDKEQPSGEWNIGGKKQRPQFNWSGGIKSRPVFVWK